MRAGEAKRGTIAGEEVAEGCGKKFAAVIALHTLDRDMKLCEDVCMEAMSDIYGIGLVG